LIDREKISKKNVVSEEVCTACPRGKVEHGSQTCTGKFWLQRRPVYYKELKEWSE
jgi:hypothetical protein